MQDSAAPRLEHCHLFRIKFDVWAVWSESEYTCANKALMMIVAFWSSQLYEALEVFLILELLYAVHSIVKLILSRN